MSLVRYLFVIINSFITSSYRSLLRFKLNSPQVSCEINFLKLIEERINKPERSELWTKHPCTPTPRKRFEGFEQQIRMCSHFKILHNKGEMLHFRWRKTQFKIVRYCVVGCCCRSCKRGKSQQHNGVCKGSVGIGTCRWSTQGHVTSLPHPPHHF